jgi:protein-disulfide isomerase
LFLPPYFRTVVWKGDLPFASGLTDDGAPWLGAREPKLTLEEYTDYLCPHCRAATAWTLKRLAARPNDIRLVRRQFPLARCSATQHGSCERLRLAFCGGEAGRFWQMDRWLFAHGDELKLDHAQAARDLGIDAGRLASCVERPDIYARAERESELAAKRRFLGTPTYVVDGKRIPPETADRYLARGRRD